jgi:hypothetical protein
MLSLILLIAPLTSATTPDPPPIRPAARTSALWTDPDPPPVRTAAPVVIVRPSEVRPVPLPGARPVQQRGGLQHDPDHQCDRCGASQYVISGRGPGGTHTHTCGRCGTVWYH